MQKTFDMKQSKIILNKIQQSFFQSVVLPFFFLLSTSNFASAQMIIDLVEVKATLDTGSIVLTWVVSSPNPGDLYTIERSGGDGVFEAIVSVKEDYVFRDQTPLEGKNIYRLSQIIADGKVIYSNKEATAFYSSIMIIDLVEVKAVPNPNDDEVVLTWTAASPKSGDLYTIERADANGIFAAIGVADGVYTFTDENPLEGESKYRLSQKISSTQMAYSNPISVTFYYSRELTLNPNPTSNNLQVHYKVEKDVTLYIQLLDQMGNLLEQHTPDTYSGGHRHINLHVNNYPSGLYFIRLVDNKAVEIEQFYKQ
jgi:hypothetical protein